MGFIKAFSGAISGTFADQWLEFYEPQRGVSATAAIIPAVAHNTNAGRGSNTSGSENIISNGSKIIVPEKMALITMENGEITGLIAEAGGFEFKSDDPNSQSVFNHDGIIQSIGGEIVDRIKFGGQPGTQQLAFYVNLKEIPGNKFGTQSKIYWNDAFFGTQVGAIVRGTYTLQIVDPLLFVKNYVPVTYLQPGSEPFDFADMNNTAAEQLFDEVVGALSAAFSNYTNDPSRENSMTKIQGDQIGFAKSLSQAVEEAYQWKSNRGLEIIKTAILAIEYDEDTEKLRTEVNAADAFAGARGNSFMQQSIARGLQAAGENGGGANMAFMGMGVNAAGSVMNSVQQQPTPSSYQPNFAAGQQTTGENNNSTSNNSSVDTEKLLEMKKLLDAGAITQEDYDKVKNQILGI